MILALFDGGRQFSLMPGADSRFGLGRNASVMAQKFFQDFRLFGVNAVYVVCAKITLFHKIKMVFLPA